MTGDYSTEIARLLDVNHEPFSFINELNKRMSNDFVKSEDETIRAAFMKAGFVITEDFLKEHCERVQIEGDKFEHIYYHFGQPDEKRIISMEREVNMSWHEEGGNLKMKAEKRYY
jgi:hypothetical protein